MTEAHGTRALQKSTTQLRGKKTEDINNERRNIPKPDCPAA
jgi:hypothetical protein